MDSEIVRLFSIDSEISSSTVTLSTYSSTHRWQMLGSVDGVFGNFSIYKPNHTECTFYWDSEKDLPDPSLSPAGGWEASRLESTFGPRVGNLYDDVRGGTNMVNAGYNGQGTSIVVTDAFLGGGESLWTSFATGNGNQGVSVDQIGNVSPSNGTSSNVNAIYARSFTNLPGRDGGRYTLLHGDRTSLDAGSIRHMDLYEITDSEDISTFRNGIRTFRLKSNAIPLAQVTFRGVAPGAQTIPWSIHASRRGWWVSKYQDDSVDLSRFNYIYHDGVSLFRGDRARAQVVTNSTSRENPNSSASYASIRAGENDIIEPLYNLNAVLLTSVGNASWDASVNSEFQDRYVVALGYHGELDRPNTREHILKTRAIAGMRFDVTFGNSETTVENFGQYPGDDETWFQDIALGTDHEFTSKNPRASDGSSFSTPKIAGCAALLMSKYINISAALVAMALKETGFRSSSNIRWVNRFSANGGPYRNYDNRISPFTRAIFGNGLVDVTAADQWIQTHCEFDNTRGYWVFKTTSPHHGVLTHDDYFIPAG